MSVPLVDSDGKTRSCLLFALVGCMAVLPCCSAPQAEQFHRVDKGMSRTEVEAILGPPSTVYFDEPNERHASGDHWPERWQYGDTLSSRATGMLFPENAPDRVWVIYFDERGTVTSTRTPQFDAAPWNPDVK